MKNFNHKRGIILYGTGLEGEKFFSTGPAYDNFHI